MPPGQLWPNVLAVNDRRWPASVNPRRWPVPLVDTVIAVMVGVFTIAGTNGAAMHNHISGRPMDAWANLLIALAAVGLVLRRRQPVVALAIAGATIFAYRMLGYPMGPFWLTLIIAFFAAVRYGPRWIGWVTVAVGYVALLWGPWLAGQEARPAAALAGEVAAWVLVLLAISEVARIRRERAATAAAARQSETQRLVSDERLRIARELHDVLAHNISLINVQAGVALHLIDEHPEQGKAALQTIKTASKETLQELRSVLGVLRQVDEHLPRSPAPSLAHLEELLGRAEAIGLDVHTESSGEVRPLPAGADLAAYRILQESLTNVAKHAGSATVTITLDYGPHELSICVDDDGTGGTVPAVPGGNGITGMRERAASLGGALQAGPRPGGGFRVEATLPLGGEHDRRPTG